MKIIKVTTNWLAQCTTYDLEIDGKSQHLDSGYNFYTGNSKKVIQKIIDLQDSDEQLIKNYLLNLAKENNDSSEETKKVIDSIGTISQFTYTTPYMELTHTLTDWT